MRYDHLLLPEPRQFASERQFADHVLAEIEPYFHIQREVHGRYAAGQDVWLDCVLRPRDPGPWFDDRPVFGVEFKRPRAGIVDRDDGAMIRQAVDYSYCEFDGYGRLAVFLCPSPVMGHLLRVLDADARAAQLDTIEYYRKWAAPLGGGCTLTDAEIEVRAQRMLRQERKRQQAIEAGARAEGFRSTVHRQQCQVLDRVGFLVRLMGAFGVGELMKHRERGWMLLRSGEPMWSELGDPVRRPASLHARFGSR